MKAASLALLALLSASAPQAPVQAPSAVPFGVGERGIYDVKFSFLHAGTATMEIPGTQNVGGVNLLRVVYSVTGGFIGMRVDDRMESWIDPQGQYSRRFIQDLNEVRYHAKRQYDFDIGSKVWRRLDKVEEGPLASPKPLDDVSMIYYIRTLALKVGDTLVFSRYWRDTGNPVKLIVLRKERISVPAGTFNTIVVRPIIRTKGIFGDGGQAEVYFSDDSRRILVAMKSDLSIGSINLYLKEYRPPTAK